MFWKKKKNKSNSSPPLSDVFKSITPRYPELGGQTALITGAGKGIGKGIALRLASEGMRVVINDIEPGLAETTASELRRLGLEALPVEADISREDQVERLFDETIKAFGTVDLLVNNAAMLDRLYWSETTVPIVEKQLDTNVKGVFMCSLKAATLMKSNQRGNIISISSVGSTRAHWQGVSYDMTKGAVDAFTRALAIELAAFGVRVNAIAPGAIHTENTEKESDSTIQKMSKQIPLNRMGTPLEIGALIAFLSSREAEYITGQVITIDGGLSTQLHPLD
jgi:NAD(P)-dependent dehydrogenase (short-subunit alcohol dehydrogenase family)